MPHSSLAHCCVFGDAVGLAEHVSAEVLVGFCICGHMVGVESHCAAVQEVPVDEGAVIVARDHGVGNAEQERGVAAWAYGDPQRIGEARGCGIFGADEHEPRAVFLGVLEVVGRIAECRPCGVVPHEYDVVGVHEIHAVVRAPEHLSEAELRICETERAGGLRTRAVHVSSQAESTCPR